MYFFWQQWHCKTKSFFLLHSQTTPPCCCCWRAPCMNTRSNTSPHAAPGVAKYSITEHIRCQNWEGNRRQRLVQPLLQKTQVYRNWLAGASFSRKWLPHFTESEIIQRKHVLCLPIDLTFWQHHLLQYLPTPPGPRMKSEYFNFCRTVVKRATPREQPTYTPMLSTVWQLSLCTAL